jgi:hyperosmotically inducible periplasmic protein
MNKKIVASFLVGFLVVATSACNEAKTTTQAPNPNASSNPTDSNTSNTAPNSPNNSPNPANSTTSNTEVAKEDAQSDVRKNQLNADIRAREERNNAGGGDKVRDDSDLASQVRSKLEANIPGGNLTVASKDGVVTVTGTVPNQDQVNKIQKLGMEIKGVKSVNVKVVVAQNKPQNLIGKALSSLPN